MGEGWAGTNSFPDTEMIRRNKLGVWEASMQDFQDGEFAWRTKKDSDCDRRCARSRSRHGPPLREAGKAQSLQEGLVVYQAKLISLIWFVEA